MAAIAMQSVSKRFGKTEVIRDVDLDVGDGEFVVFVGPSGCGKSTLLRLIAGLEDVSSGHIRFDDTNVTDLAPAERGVAMVFQSYALYPHMSVYENMAFGLKLAKTDKHKLGERVREAARILQIEPLLERKPRELSGGQRQRVAIGRAIVRKPRVFLFDEPLSNLDAALRVQMRIELRRLHRDLGTTMIYVTHDQVEAMTLADRIVVLNGGRVEQVGSPLELYERPRNLFVAGFIGSPKMNVLDGTVAASSNDRATVDVGGQHAIVIARQDAAPRPGARVTVGLRPEHLSVTDAADAPIRGKVVAVEHLGSESYVYVEHGRDEPLVVKASGDADVRVGQKVAVSVPPLTCYLFDADGNALPLPQPRAHSGSRNPGQARAT